MQTFDFRHYHVRSINASDDSERAKINQELKQLYDSLDDDSKKEFNIQLEKFLIKEYAATKSVIDGIKNNQTN